MINLANQLSVPPGARHVHPQLKGNNHLAISNVWTECQEKSLIFYVSDIANFAYNPYHNPAEVYFLEWVKKRPYIPDHLVQLGLAVSVDGVVPKTLTTFAQKLLYLKIFVQLFMFDNLMEELMSDECFKNLRKAFASNSRAPRSTYATPSSRSFPLPRRWTEDPESDLRLHDYMVMQKKLTQSKIEYDATLKQREEEDLKNKQQLEDMRRDLKQKQREIAMLKSNEDFKTKQINELKDQIEITEKTSSTQKNSAATLKKQKDELEAENNRMQESLKEKEEVLHYAMARLSAKEADALRERVSALPG
ncbi:hypothetical protein BGX28_009747 [Mortierella sp. GBA30]|nr:hypothetical protein BGX28_009747 [Mortierella sp. GBA30]